MQKTFDNAPLLTADSVIERLRALADPDKAAVLARFFKTGKGEYGEGDKFLGIPVPPQRELAKRCTLLPLTEIERLLESGYHECRLTALLTLVRIYDKAKDTETRGSTYDFYIAHYERINNWDLVDLSAPQIVGGHILRNKRYGELTTFAASPSLWLQRISIVSTYTLIKAGEFTPTFEVSKALLHHSHDLIHKAVGWMLREVGKKDMEAEEAFLLDGGRYRTMPRTMLRYAIEKFPEEKRRMYLNGSA